MKYRFVFRETWSMHQDVEADSFEEAFDAAQQAYDSGEIDFSYAEMEDSEQRMTCSFCDEELGYTDRDYTVDVVGKGTICLGCFNALKQRDRLKRCNNCDAVFDVRTIKNKMCPKCNTKGVF